MNLFEVYKLWDIEPVKGLDTTLWDKNGEVYTDLYGGHAVINYCMASIKVGIDLTILIPQCGIKSLYRLDVPQFIYFK